MVYRTIKTTTGHKFKVKMSDAEIRGRRMYWAAVTVLPFVTSALMFWIWVKCG